jgi:hypothetical protein
MIRLTWLQFRAQAVTAAAALAAFAVLLAVTGPHMASMYAASGISSCQGASCGNLATTYLQALKADGGDWLYLVSVASIFLAPALIGLFWGAPLIAHELETGTSDLAWTQSITRTRWLAVKLTVGGLAAMALTEGMSLMQAWWAAPIGRAVGYGAHNGNGLLFMGQFSLLVFATHGITPLGYAAFAFTLGVTAGALIGRTVPAMAIALAVFAVIQIAVPLWIRPHLFPARHTFIPVASLENTSLSAGSVNGSNRFTLGVQGLVVPGQPGAWVLSSTTVNAAGRATSTAPAICFTSSVLNSNAGFVGCLASHGFQEGVSYQPASRYWAFQGDETAIYLAVTLAMAGYCFRRLNRRLS